MLRMNKAALLAGLATNLIDNNYCLVNAFFGSRFSCDKRYRIFALAGTNNTTYGIVGGNPFVINVIKRDEARHPLEFSISLLHGNSIIDYVKDSIYSDFIVKKV